MKILHVDSSIMGENSVSRRLTTETVARLRTEHPAASVEYLDLAKDAPSHLSQDSIGFRTGADALTAAQRKENEVSERLVRQFLAADVVVVGAPFYNFGIPSQLKAWIDRIAQVGRTFRYTEKGPVGLAGGKSVIVVSTRGGLYSTSDRGQAMEHQESYLRTVFAFLGIDDVRIVRAEGLAMGEVPRKQALAAASAAIESLVALAANEGEVAQVA